MSLPTVLHPDVVDFLRQDVEISLRERVWHCLHKLKLRQFDSGLRVKKLKGITKRVWEARINQGSRLIFTYEKSQQPETGESLTYIAVQDICLDHDNVSHRARARHSSPDAAWLEAELVEVIGNIEAESTEADDGEKAALKAEEAADLSLNQELTDELLGNIQWQVLESEEQWQRAIIEQDAELPLKLTSQEYELVKIPSNLLLSGSAGTGKTTVALYRLLHSLENSPSGKRLYVAYNHLLVSNAQEQFNRLLKNTKVEAEIEEFFQFQTLRNLCLEILATAGKSYRTENEANFQAFAELYQAHPKSKQYPAYLIWDEIRSIIKGAQLTPEADILTKKDYESLGKKRSSVIAKKQRYEVYKLAQWYQSKLKSDGKFDEIDLAREVLKIIAAGGANRYQLIVCDEVQDFTEIQLELLFQLLEPEGNIVFGGDLNQMISPSGFRWEELKQKFYRSNREVTQKTLSFNFRSVGTLVNLANQMLQLRSRLLGIPVVAYTGQAISYGKLAQVIKAPPEELSSELGQLHPEDAILVRTDADKQKLRQELQSSLVFTVEEAKGLEFDTVFLVEFFQPAQELWSKVLRGSSLKEKEAPQLQLELNLLYVAITRTRRILNIWESTPSPIWQQPELKGCVELLNPESVNSYRAESTLKIWRERGIYYLNAEFYQQAQECFAKAGEQQLEKQAQVKLLMQQREYSKAAQILADLQEWEEAALLYERVKKWQEAGQCWANAGKLEQEQLCEIYILEAASKWEEAASKWEAMERPEEAKRCLINIPEKKAEYQAIELEKKKQWLKAAQRYDVAKLPQKAAECRLQEFEKRKQWKQVVQQYEILGMPAKAEESRKYGAQSLLVRGLSKHCMALEKGQRDKIREAVEDFTESLELNPDCAQAYYNRGLALVELGKSQRAIADFNKAIEMNSEYAEAYTNRGYALIAQKDYKGAIADFNKALQLNPQDSQAYNNRGLALIELGDAQGAIAAFDQALKLNPHYAKAFNNRGLLRFQLRDFQGAIKDYYEALRINPQYSEAHRNLSVAQAVQIRK